MPRGNVRGFKPALIKKPEAPNPRDAEIKALSYGERQEFLNKFVFPAVHMMSVLGYNESQVCNALGGMDGALSPAQWTRLKCTEEFRAAYAAACEVQANRAFLKAISYALDRMDNNAEGSYILAAELIKSFRKATSAMNAVMVSITSNGSTVSASGDTSTRTDNALSQLRQIQENMESLKPRVEIDAEVIPNEPPPEPA